MRVASTLAVWVLLASLAPVTRAYDKNGVAPRAISLPAGPGSIQGLGESFQAQLNTGSGTTAVAIALPKGTAGLTPELALAYDSGAGNGPLGLGWSLAGIHAIRRNTDRGVPLYVDGADGLDNDRDGTADNPEELDAFTGIGGEELVELADGTFRAENEGAFYRYRRVGGGWEARSRDGRQLLFGETGAARVEASGRTFEWCLERITDPNGNTIELEYIPDPATPARKYPGRIRWGQGGAYFAVALRYEEGRPDVATSYRSGFELRTTLRLSGIDVLSHGIPAPAFALREDLDGDGDGELDALIRRYRLEYEGDAHISLLARVTLLGADGLSALPSQSFGYRLWTPPDSVAAHIIRSRDAPAAGFDSPSVELIDMNGDALPDLLSTAGSQHRVHLNKGVAGDGRLVWAPGRPVGNAPAIDISSDRTHLADATADGLADLLVKISNTSFLCYDNTSQSSWTGSPFPIRNTDTWPIWPYDGDGGRLSRSFDSDYSRSNDVLHTSETGAQLWLLLPGGRFARELRLPPLVCEGKVFRFDLPGTQIADLNGDRLQDLAWIQASRVVYFPNRGRGDFGVPVIFSLGSKLTAAEIERADFSDIDGDGLADLTVVRPAFLPTGVAYWLNRFEHGFDGPRSVTGLPPAQKGDALRWADMNGNGTTDIAISQAVSAAGEKVLAVELAPGGKPHLLERIENGLGLEISMGYEASTEQMVRAETEGAPWSSTMPVAVTVLARLVEADGLSPPFVQSYTYRDPFYDPAKQEFRGFQRAELHEAGDASAAAKVRRLLFDTGRTSACLKGKVLAEETRSEDETLSSRIATSWSERVLAEGIDGRQVCFAFTAASDRFVHEGEAEGVRIRTEMDYDDFGNPTRERRHGVLASLGDEVFVERAFDVRAGVWHLDLMSRETTLDGSGTRVREERFFHDERGNLERVESWLDTEDRMVSAIRQRFDGFGNVVETTDPRGSRRSVGFDPWLHAMAVSETIHLDDRDLSMAAEVDVGFGVVTGAVTFAGERTEYSYDPLGRLVAKEMPGGAGERYEYHLSSPVSHVLKRRREDAGEATFDSYTFSDGYGRPLLTKIEAAGGRWRCLDAKAYNARKLEATASLPYESESSSYEPPDSAAPREERFYDAEGRAVRTVRADGSTSRTEHRPLVQAVYGGNDSALDGDPDFHTSDGLGRTTAVEERNGDEVYVTRYRWNARGELETVTDALGNTKLFRFDSLQRLLESDDPDRGLVTYIYDDSGNRVRRADARGQVITYAYDAADRLLEKVYRVAAPDGGDVREAAYHYDAAAGELDFGDGTRGSARNVLGRLAWVEDSSGEEHYSYDERGNIEWVLKRILDPRTGLLVSYRTQRRYDLMDREAEIVYPDNDRLRCLYDAGSFASRIDGGPAGVVILAGAEYAPSGQPLALRFGNETVSTCEYDRNQRLVRLRTDDASGSPVLHQILAYDADSNVVSITDERPVEEVPEGSPRRATVVLAYDELHRLTEARYGGEADAGTIDYAYDALGNLLSQSARGGGSPGLAGDPAVDLGALAYAGGRSGRSGRRLGDPPGPHAVTASASGSRFSYDESGNLVAFDGARLAWDFEDRMARYAKGSVEAKYVFDHAGRRVAKDVARGRNVETAFYPDRVFKVRGGVVEKHVFLEERRIARAGGRLDPQREAVERLVLASGWNLIAVAVTSGARLRDVFGADAAIYEALGGSYAAVDGSATLPSGKALWVHAPSARIAVVRGSTPAEPAATPPGPLHAWPRLDPFRPAEHVSKSTRLLVYDAAARRWLRRDESLPAFLSDAPAELGPAQAFWSEDRVAFSAGDPGGAVVFYHQDHLGSTAVVTSGTGELLEERTYYPFGGVRNVHREGLDPGIDHELAGKERDAESGLIAMGARGYLDLAGVFLSPDPRFTEAARLGLGREEDRRSFAAFLSNPQIGNPYAYALRNPLRFIDPAGLEVVISPALRDTPAFMKAWKIFEGTKEGQRLLKSLEAKGAKVYLRASKKGVKDAKVGSWTTALGQQYTGPAEGKNLKPGEAAALVNVYEHHKAFDKFGTKRLIQEFAETIHHELRHAEGDFYAAESAAYKKMHQTIEDLNKALGGAPLPANPFARTREEIHESLDNYNNPSDDPFNAEFQKEIGR